MKMSRCYKRQGKKNTFKKKKINFPPLCFAPWGEEMLILQLTDGPPGMTSWFPPRWPRLVMGKDFGGGMKDIRLPPQRQRQEHCTCRARHGIRHGMWWVFPRDETSPSPTGPSPTTTTSHATEQEAAGWAHTSPAIKLIFLISTGPSHPVTGHRKY